MDYQQADFTPLRDSGYGIMVHWTERTLSRCGKTGPFTEAVDNFDVTAFVDQTVATGAGHVMFPVNHVNMFLPCPSHAVDAVLPGRTCDRDLIAELADALAAENIALMLYYNHGICGTDPEWTEATGYADDDFDRFYDSWQAVVGELGERYGPKCIAWWFDGGKTYRCWPDAWPQMAATAKRGHPGRLITYNCALEATASLTDCQDYWAGEIARTNYVPRGPRTPSGLSWYGLVDWHAHHEHMWAGIWGLWEPGWLEIDWPAPSTQTLAELYGRFADHGGTVTFNLLIDRQGAIIDEDITAMSELKKQVKQ